ncbi:uncharacterized protein A4U43_C04F11340 [Asparagus officinalis]|uniref:Uncharacterized protein n=1 Tax=Asparagus officinalis TaxID=4686 RepID=A0A5P1F5E0_ASPOF|nr:uncharacterized protein A4U43_C04F11340 [Asparagus officinalis]
MACLFAGTQWSRREHTYKSSQRPHRKKKGLHDIGVAIHDPISRDLDLRLELVLVNGLWVRELDEGDGERSDGVDDEEEDDVVGVEPEVVHAGGVPEPERLGAGEVAAEEGLRLGDAFKGQHHCSC